VQSMRPRQLTAVIQRSQAPASLSLRQPRPRPGSPRSSSGATSGDRSVTRPTGVASTGTSPLSVWSRCSGTSRRHQGRSGRPTSRSLARSREARPDLRLALDVLAGPYGAASAAIRLDLPAARVGDLSECRIAAWVDDPACPVDIAVRSQIEAMLGLAERAGAVVTEAILPIGMEELYDLGLQLLAGALARRVPQSTYEALAEVTAADPAGSGILAKYARAVTQSHRAWLAAHGRRERLRQQMDEFFDQYDVLVTANSPVQAMPHDHTGNELEMTITVNGRPRPWIDLLPWTALANIAYLPATTVPTGLGPSGLPVGCQVIGREHTDRTTIAVAGLLGELTGGYRVPPGVS
jgi:amidase